VTLQLTSDQANNVTVTLYETEQTEYDYYLFVFKSDQEQTEYTVLTTDTSTNPLRWNTMSITEGTDDRTNGSVVLGNEGFYTYEVYGQASSSNLDKALVDSGLLEQGKMLLDDGNGQTFVSNDIDSDFVVNKITS